MKHIFYPLVLVFFLLICCDNRSKVEAEISKVEIALKLSRFDRELAKTTSESLPILKEKYPYLYPQQYPDSLWIAKLTDTLQISLLEEVNVAFGDFNDQEDELNDFYRHVKYYFSKEKIPEIVTVISDVNYDSPVILTNDFLLLGLDNYLGPDHKFYSGLSNYISDGLDKKFLLSDVAAAYAAKHVRYPTNDRTFLALMIYHGKILYLKDKLIPAKTDAEKIKYSQEEINWAFANEEPIWRQFVEKEYLFSTDKELSRRFLDPAPYSKFGLDLDSESPGRLGRYLGWQIVRAFADKNNVTLEQLLTVTAEQIYKKANYKPKK